MLTPIDIHNRQLKPAKIGGYDKKDIDDFVEEIIASYEELYNENRVLKEKITSLSEGIQYYKKMEGTLQKALVLAEKTSTETQEAAKSQADSVITEASAKAEALSRETKAEIDALRAEAQAQAEVTRAKANRELEETRNHVRKLVQSYENYRLQFKKLAEAQIEMLESDSFSIFVPELDELMNEAPSADSVLDNPGVIPINIGSPAPFEEPPVETDAVTEAVSSVSPDSVEKPAEQEQAAVEAVVEAHRKLDVKFDDLSNSIAIPISSNMGPFTDLPEEDSESDAIPLQDLKIDSSTAPSIDINIGTAIGEEIEVSMSLDPPLSSVESGNDTTIDILVNTQSLLSGSIDDIQAEATDNSAVEEKPVVEQVAVSTPTPAEVSGQPAVVPISLEQPAVEPLAASLEQPSISATAGAIEPVASSLEQPITEPDVLELVPEPVMGQESSVATGTVEPVITSLEQPILGQDASSAPETVSPFMEIPTAVEQPAEPDVLELVPEPVMGQENTVAAGTVEPVITSLEQPILGQDASSAPETVSPFMEIPAAVEQPAEPDVLSLANAQPVASVEQDALIPAQNPMESPVISNNALVDPGTPEEFVTSIPVSSSLESPADVSVEPQGMNIPLNFESPVAASAEPQGMNIPLNFESSVDASAGPQDMNIPISFESPVDMSADPQGMNIPLNFESPVDMSTDPQGMNIPISFESPEDIQPEPQSMNVPIGFESPEDLQTESPKMNIPLTDIPMLEPMAETQQPITNGIMDTEPAAAASDAFIDMSAMFDSPVQDLPEESTPEPMPTSDNGFVDPGASNNGIISDAFIDPTAMFESPVEETPQEQPQEPAKNPNDAMMDINPFNFIDPE